MVEDSRASEILAAVDETTTKKDVYESVQDYLANMPKASRGTASKRGTDLQSLI